MPFIKKTKSRGLLPLSKAIFIGRTNELLFFTEHILKPEEPTYNIVSISGNGGVGKSTLLAQFIHQAHSPDFKNYCLTALADERQPTPISIMEKFSDQLREAGHPLTKFEQALGHYKESLQKQQAQGETANDAILHDTAAVLGSVSGVVPVVGRLLQPITEEAAEGTVKFFAEKYQEHERLKEASHLDDPIDDLTNTFVDDLNHLIDAGGVSEDALNFGQSGREYRVILFFDTFDQLAITVAPWLLHSFLESEINNNVVLVLAGRIPIEHSTPDDPKIWLPYRDDHASIHLDSFTKEETYAYLAARGITDPVQTESIWQVSWGLPLYLSLLTFNPDGDVDPTADVVANFLRWIPEQEPIKRRLALEAALLTRPFNQDDLAAFSYLAEQDVPTLYAWLVGQPFVQSSSQAGRFRYHELAQELFCRHLYRISPRHCQETRRGLAEYYEQQIEKTQDEEGHEVYNSDTWLELVLALVYQLFLLPDESSHIIAIGQVVRAYVHTGRTGEITKVLHDLSQNQPNNLANANARTIAAKLLQCIEADLASQEFLEAHSYLLAQAAQEPSLSPEFVAAIYRMRGQAYISLHQYEQAIQDFDQSIALNPQDSWTYAHRGFARLWMKDVAQATLDYKHSCKIDREHAYACWMSAWAALCLGRADAKATEELETLAAVDPLSYIGRVCQGVALWLRHNFEQAAAVLEQAIALRPDMWDAHFWKGMACASLERDEDAMQEVEKALTLGLPPALLAPLKWFEQDRPEFYEKYVVPLLT